MVQATDSSAAPGLHHSSQQSVPQMALNPSPKPYLCTSEPQTHGQEDVDDGADAASSAFGRDVAIAFDLVMLLGFRI